MQIFIDSADPEQIRTAWSWGIMDGITTNPSLAAKVGKPYSEIVTEILSIIDADTPVSLEVIAEDYEGMIEQAHTLAALDDRIVVKLPCTPAGIRATKKLSSEGILVNVTLVFSVRQALIAAKAGAYYVSPFVGRLDDIETGAGDEVVERIIKVYGNYGFETGILFASTRDITHFEIAAELGVDIVTAPFSVLEQIHHHKLTDQGLERFKQDWEQSGLELPV